MLYQEEGKVASKKAKAQKASAKRSLISKKTTFLSHLESGQAGMGAYYSLAHDLGLRSQWAMGRVKSFATGRGGARKADADLWKKVKARRSA